MGNKVDRAMGKLLGSFSSGVEIAQPSGGERMDSSERERLREGMERVKGEDEGQKSAPAKACVPVPSDDQAQPQASRQRGRPRKGNSPENPVLMNFRVDEEYRQRIKVLAVDRRVSISELFYEAFDLLFEKLGV